MLALAEAVEIGFGRVAFQSAEYHKLRDGGISQLHAAPQGLVHCLLVVHLAVAHLLVTLAIALAVLATHLDELLGGDELDAGILDVASMNGLGVGMLAQQFQLGGERADGCLHPIAVRQPEANNLHHYVHHHLQLSCAQVAILVAEILQLLEALLTSLCWAHIEQRLAVLTLRRAWMNLKFYSVSLTWHILLEQFCCKVTKKE